MCVLDVKSSAWKPTRSIVGAIARMSRAVRPVAPQRLWLPSRVVVSTMSTTRRHATSTRKSGCPYSTASRVLDADLDDRAGDAGGDRVHHLHHLDDADDRVGLDPRRRPRRTAPRPAPARGRRCRASATSIGARPSRGRLARQRRLGSAGGAAPPRTTWSDSPSVSTRSSSRSDSSMSRRISRTSSSSAARAQLLVARARRTCSSRATSPSAAASACSRRGSAVTGRDWRTNRLAGSSRRARAPTRRPGASRSSARSRRPTSTSAASAARVEARRLAPLRRAPRPARRRARRRRARTRSPSRARARARPRRVTLLTR